MRQKSTRHTTVVCTVVVVEVGVNSRPVAYQVYVNSARCKLYGEMYRTGHFLLTDPSTPTIFLDTCFSWQIINTNSYRCVYFA